MRIDDAAPKADREPLLGVRELARELRVPDRTIYAWLHAGTAPRSFRIGKYRRFRRADVDAWLESRAS